jgi:hypothetical protein
MRGALAGWLVASIAACTFLAHCSTPAHVDGIVSDGSAVDVADTGATTDTGTTTDAGLDVVDTGAMTDAGLDAADTGVGDDASDAFEFPDVPGDGSHAPLPLVDYLGGPIIATPRVVTATYTGDPQQTSLETFDDTIMTTPWWDAVRAGYCDHGTPATCVGPGTAGPHVHLTDTPAATYTDSPTGGTLRTLMQGYINSGVFPPPDANTIYALFIPATTRVVVDGSKTTCQAGFAYHASFAATVPGDGGTAIAPYVIVARCSTSLNALTDYTSHELIETATDPVGNDPNLSGTAYNMTSDTVWPIFDGNEVADLCLWPNGTQVTTTEGTYTVQRTWSNLAAAAGHDPCVPAPSPTIAPYFNVAPVMDRVTLAVGATTVLPLDAFSDGTLPDWTVSIADVSATSGGTSGAVSSLLNRSTANNGTRLLLEITMRTAAPATKPALLMITSQSGGTVHTWPIAITSQ